MSESVKIGLVGVGNIGGAHLRWIASHPGRGLRVAALCDVDPAKRERLMREYPDIPVFADHREMIASGLAEAVVIAAPHYFHPPIAIDAFAAGLHVLTEKPAGVSVKAVREMNEAAKASGKVFAIMFNQRANPLFAKARELVRGGSLGEPKRLVWIVTNWYRTQAYYDSGGWRATWNGEGGGVLLNQAPHNLDLWQWIFGLPRRVMAFCAFGKYHHIAVEDDVTIHAAYDNGATAEFITTTGEAPGTNRLEIAGDRGKLVLEDGRLRWWRLSEPERAFCFASREGFFQPETAYEEFTFPEPDGHPIILQNFAAAIRRGEPLIAPGEEGVRSLSISNAAYLSAWTGGWAELPVDEERFEALIGERRRAETVPSREAKAERMGEGYSERWQVRW